jgi:hypothetical protein
LTDNEITITAGRPNREGDWKDFAGPDGTYAATLIAVTDPITAKSSMADAKGDGTWTYRDWTFAIDGGTPFDGQVIDVRANASSSGPKSKQFAIIAALVGRTPPVGAKVDIQQHLIGRSCLLGIRTNENDYPFADTFMAVPGSAAAAPAAPQAAPAPPAVPSDASAMVPAAAATAREQVAAENKALPF